MVAGATMARTLWPGEDPVGKCVRVQVDTAPCTYVVGVAEDIHSRTIGAEERYFYYYVPAAQVRPDESGLFVRVSGDARSHLEPLRARLQQEMPGTAYVTVTRLGDNIETATRSWTMGARLFTAFGILALLLASVGLYSVISYNIAQRRQELAVRIALGASVSSVVRLVLAQGVRLGAAGIIIGGLIAYMGARAIEPLLFNQRPRDPVVFGVVAGLLMVVTIAASLIPARRATRVNPRSVLQSG
jgi:ABC-type antimicrobial peptide transport system permease subunit